MLRSLRIRVAWWFAPPGYRVTDEPVTVPVTYSVTGTTMTNGTIYPTYYRKNS